MSLQVNFNDDYRSIFKPIEQPETTQNLIFLILSLQANILVKADYHIGQKLPQNRKRLFNFLIFYLIPAKLCSYIEKIKLRNLVVLKCLN